MTTDREYRLYKQEYPVDDSKKGNVRYQDGELRPGVNVQGQNVHLNFSEIYPDDAIALIRDMYTSLYPSEYNTDIIASLQKAIYTADKRSVAKHGYSWNEEERDLKLPSDY